MASYYLQDSGGANWLLGIGNNGKETWTPSTVTTLTPPIVLKAADGSYYSLTVSTAGRSILTGISATAECPIILNSPDGNPWRLSVTAAEKLQATLGRSVCKGVFSKDAVLYVGTFDVGIIPTYGLFDDDFVHQFDGPTVGASVLQVDSVPVGLFSKDASLDGAFDS